MSTEPFLKPIDLLPRKKTYPYYYGIREWLTQTVEENKFDGAILSSEMFLYGNGYWSMGMLIDQPIRIDFFSIFQKLFKSGLIASRISNDTTEEIIGRWDFVKELQSLYRFKVGDSRSIEPSVAPRRGVHRSLIQVLFVECSYENTWIQWRHGRTVVLGKLWTLYIWIFILYW